MRNRLLQSPFICQILVETTVCVIFFHIIDFWNFGYLTAKGDHFVKARDGSLVFLPTFHKNSNCST